jgi:nucleoside-diphosphate-sugar epimerase
MQRYPDDLLVHDKSTEKPHQVYLAATKLGWTPKISFDELVAEMVREDLKSAERDELFKKHGYKAMDYHE